jgi:hypothetical protein
MRVEYVVSAPAPNSNPQSIARGPEGSVWFGEVGSGKVGLLR